MTSYSYTDREQLAASAGGSVATFAYDKANNPVTVGANTQTFDAAGPLCWSSATPVTGPTCAAVPSGGPDVHLRLERAFAEFCALWACVRG